MGDLEQVHVAHPAEQLGIDFLFDVTRQQEPPARHGSEQDDGHVVDAGPRVPWRPRNAATHRPQHLERDVVHGESITGREQAAGRRAAGELGCPGRVPRTRAEHPRFEGAPDAIPLEQEGESRDVVLVRVGEHDSVQPAVPRRNPPIELDEQPVGIRAAVHQQPAAPRALDEDRVALADVENGHGRTSRRSLDDDRRRQRDRRRQCDDSDARRSRDRARHARSIARHGDCRRSRTAPARVAAPPFESGQ
jgi:hypothetical protein